MAMSQFRRSLKAETKKMGGKGGKGQWRDKWRLPQEEPTPLVLISAEYVDNSPPTEAIEIDPTTGRPKPVMRAFFKAKKHKRKMFKNGGEWFADEMCSAGHDPHNPQPCVGCFAGDQGDKTVTTADIFAFGLVHLAPYHGHPVLDDKGQIMISKSREGGNVINYAECEGRVCNYCRTLSGSPLIITPDAKWPGWHPQHITTLFGQRRYFEIGKGHLQNLESWDGTVGGVCGNCRSKIDTIGYRCPTCSNRVIDVSTDSRTDEQIIEAVGNPYPCMACQRPVSLVEETVCRVCTSQGRNGVPLSLFGTVLHGLREGEGTNSSMVLRRFQTVHEFETEMMNQQIPCGLFVHQLTGNRNMQQLIDDLAKPYDFPEIMKPRSLADQAKRLDLPLPPSAQGQGYQPQGQQQGFQPYNVVGGQAVPQHQQQQQGQQGYQAQGYQQQPQQNAQPQQGQQFVPQQQQQGFVQQQQQPQYGGAAASPQVAQQWTTGPGHTGNTGPQPVQQNWTGGQQQVQQQQFVPQQQVQAPPGMMTGAYAPQMMQGQMGGQQLAPQQVQQQFQQAQQFQQQQVQAAQHNVQGGHVQMQQPLQQQFVPQQQGQQPVQHQQQPQGGYNPQGQQPVPMQPSQVIQPNGQTFVPQQQQGPGPTPFVPPVRQNFGNNGQQ